MVESTRVAAVDMEDIAAVGVGVGCSGRLQASLADCWEEGKTSHSTGRRVGIALEVWVGWVG